MKKQIILGILLLVLSTLCYYVPTYFANLRSFDLSEVPDRFYNHFRWKTSGAFLLTAIYSCYLFFIIDPRKLALKLIVCWLFIAETFTFINHVINKFYKYQLFNEYEIVITCSVFIICFIFFLGRALHVDKSTKFNPEKTYILRFKPKNILGIFNHIVNLKGHVAVYQDGRTYKFRKKSGKIEAAKFSTKSTRILIESGQLSIKLIPRVEDVWKLIGNKYNFFKYNCNHLEREARKK